MFLWLNSCRNRQGRNLCQQWDSPTSLLLFGVEFGVCEWREKSLDVWLIAQRRPPISETNVSFKEGLLLLVFFSCSKLSTVDYVCTIISVLSSRVKSADLVKTQDNNLGLKDSILKKDLHLRLSGDWGLNPVPEKNHRMCFGSTTWANTINSRSEDRAISRVLHQWF